MVANFDDPGAREEHIDGMLKELERRYERGLIEESAYREAKTMAEALRHIDALKKMIEDL